MIKRSAVFSIIFVSSLASIASAMTASDTLYNQLKDSTENPVLVKKRESCKALIEVLLKKDIEPKLKAAVLEVIADGCQTHVEVIQSNCQSAAKTKLEAAGWKIPADAHYYLFAPHSERRDVAAFEMCQQAEYDATKLSTEKYAESIKQDLAEQQQEKPEK